MLSVLGFRLPIIDIGTRTKERRQMQLGGGLDGGRTEERGREGGREGGRGRGREGERERERNHFIYDGLRLICNILHYTQDYDIEY